MAGTLRLHGTWQGQFWESRNHPQNPYPLHRQKAFIVPRVVPEMYLDKLEQVVTWDEWDPNRDSFSIDWKDYSEG